MKAAIYRGINDISVENIEKPSVGNGELLVKVKACAICGGDLRTFKHGHNSIKPPIVLGHEFAGAIVETGEGIERYHTGNRVIVAPGIGCGSCSYCLSGHQNLCPTRKTIAHIYNGGFAEYVKIPANAVRAGNVNFIPDEVDYLSASLAEPLACVINGQEAMNIQLGDTVAVIGAGPIGLMHAELARAHGAGKVFLINRSGKRLEGAKNFKYDAYIDTSKEDAATKIMDLTEGLGVNAAIVTAGSADAQNMGIRISGKMGKVCLFAGLPKDKPLLNFDVNFIHYRQITLYGTFSSAPRHNALAIEMIRSKKIDADKLLTHIVALDDICRGMELVEKRAGLRVAVIPDMRAVDEDIKKHKNIIVG
ncbi:zinc-dependent dehydrogenase [Pectinatus haikarae]|uniref:zinc-dependent dehydrogenase n=1 Tax=Pectinatus haikarae TaxID=349096 RepID=UPI0018C5E7EB|nr:zinc-dependent dehydrogenase [Pectinatus haikarae]